MKRKFKLGIHAFALKEEKKRVSLILDPNMGISSSRISTQSLNCCLDLRSFAMNQCLVCESQIFNTDINEKFINFE